MKMLQRRHLLLSAAALGLPAARAQGGWAAIERAARGQTVYFNAWGGSERINAYIQWAASALEASHRVTLVHVKLADTAEMVRRVRAEKAAGRREGSADMVWINGENFLAMKREGLLFGPFAESLPNYRYVDVKGKPTTRIDFAEPVDGLEAAWGMAQLTFYVDTARAPLPQPLDMDGLLAWCKAQPGRFSYPKPPQFIGTTFVKQVLAERGGDRAALSRPYTPGAFARVTPPLWAYLDELHPLLWRGGRQFPASPGALRQMVSDGELVMGLSFNPNEAANEIAARTLPPTVASFQPSAGSIGNTHFLAIPFNARAPDGAQVAINFLQSPAAQARKADIRFWGDPTVLALDKLSADERALFTAAAGAPGTVPVPAPTWPEPHGSWVEPLEAQWLRRYG
jgi:putative thiamine transport system substrate-binding protein